MATFSIRAAPPAQLLLSASCLAALDADKWLRLHLNTAAAPVVTDRAVAVEGLADAALPALVGFLADGWVAVRCLAPLTPNFPSSAVSHSLQRCPLSVPLFHDGRSLMA